MLPMFVNKFTRPFDHLHFLNRLGLTLDYKKLQKNKFLVLSGAVKLSQRLDKWWIRKRMLNELPMCHERSFPPPPSPPFNSKFD